MAIYNFQTRTVLIRDCACRIYKGVADKTAQNNYRADLREEAVARVSAIRRSQKPKKETPPQKLRGSKARQAAEKDSE